jgi:hypothetical protein
MSQQTAVEWLQDNIQSDMTFMEIMGLIRQAKAMEKEQRNKDYNVGYMDAKGNHTNDCENYGNEQEYLTNQEFDDSDQFGLKTPMH